MDVPMDSKYSFCYTPVDILCWVGNIDVIYETHIIEGLIEMIGNILGISMDAASCWEDRGLSQSTESIAKEMR